MTCPRTLVLLGLATIAAAQPYDLLLKGGHVIDPANRMDAIADVAISAGKVARVAPDIPSADARQTLNLRGYYVTPGLIDLHTHVYLKGRASTVVADDAVLPHGTTTIVDAGVAGWKNFEDFKTSIIDQSQVRILALLNIVGSGMHDDQSKENLVADMDPRATAAKIAQYPDILVGVKSAHFTLQGWESVERAVAAGRIANRPVMLDSSIFSNSGRTTAEKLLAKMRPGDIHTHLFNDHQLELVDRFTNKVQPWMWEARKRGVIFDLGHGGGGFLWPVAQAALSQGFLPDTIGTDLHPGSILMLQASVPNAISKLMNLGMSLQEGIARSTVHPAKAIGRYPELGTLNAGAVADIAVFQLQTGAYAFIDSMRKKLTGTKRLECVLTVRAGKVVFDRDSRLLPLSRSQVRLAPLPDYPFQPAPAAADPAVYDLVLRQGKVIDPGNNRFGRFDIGIQGDKVVRIARRLPATHARMIVDASDYYLTPGFVDVQADVNFIDSIRGVQPDHRSLPFGVTTIADPTVSPEAIRRSRVQLLPIAAKSLQSGWLASGMNRANVLAEHASMSRSMSLRLNEGVPLAKVVEAVTVLPARAIGREDLGVLREGAPADIAMVEVQQGDFPLVDFHHQRLQAKARIRCVMTIRKGEIMWDLQGLSIREWTQAGRYTSYR